MTSTTRRGVLVGFGSLALGAAGTTSGYALRSSTSATASPTNPAGVDQSGVETFVDQQLADRIGETVPGAIVAIVVGDQPVLTKGYGYANIDDGTDADATNTAFRIGSVGKLVTWSAVMQGVEDGWLDLDENVNTYLQDSTVTIPDTYDDPVTLRHLGTHTAGFESVLNPHLVTSEDQLDPLETVLADHQPDRVRPPGDVVGYSNYGAALAGHIIAEVQDTSFENYVQDAVFEPLGMTDSTFAQPVPEDSSTHLASGHSQADTSFSTSDDVYINMRPAGSMTATATDMARFMSALLGDGALGNTRILTADTVETMHAVQHVRHPAVTNWRYGFHEYGHPDANLISHSGGTVNFTSRLVLAPDHDVGIFIAYNINNEAERPAAIADAIINQYSLQPAPTTPTPTRAPGGQERTASVAGEYSATHLPDSGPLQVADLLARVTVRPTGAHQLKTETLEEQRRWIETAPYVYTAVDGRDVLAFDVSDDDVTAMYLSNEPTGVYRPVPVHEQQVVTGGVLGGALSGFGLSLTGWGGVGAWRWWKRNQQSVDEGGA